MTDQDTECPVSCVCMHVGCMACGLGGTEHCGYIVGHDQII